MIELTSQLLRDHIEELMKVIGKKLEMKWLCPGALYDTWTKLTNENYRLKMIQEYIESYDIEANSEQEAVQNFYDAGDLQPDEKMLEIQSKR